MVLLETQKMVMAAAVAAVAVVPMVDQEEDLGKTTVMVDQGEMLVVQDL
tara:strand:+ start:303 stop:449 length:147 start_codon:yes stop_codon:yes gene_type:complete